MIQGHPDGNEPHHCHALAASYAEGASEAEHHVREVNLSTLDFPLLRSRKDWETGVKSLERNILGIVGIGPVHVTLIGLTDSMKDEDAQK